MTTETGEETKVAIQETPKETQEPKPETPAAETVETLRQQLAESKTKLEQTEKGLRTAHTTLTEKDRLLKEQTDLREEIASIREEVKIAIGWIAEKESGTDEDLAPGKKQELKQRFDNLEKERVAKRQLAEANTIVQGFRTRVEDLKLDPLSDDYLDIKDFAESGKYARAEARLKKLEGQKQVTTKEPEKKVETPEQMRARIKAEVTKEILIERGELKSETGRPSGGTGKLTVEAIRKMSPQELVANAKEIAKMPLTL